MGDFNADFFRKNPLDLIIQKFIKDHSLTPFDCLQTQKATFSYLKELKKRDNHMAFLDHVLIINFDKVLSPHCNIIDDVANLSDHRALTITFQIFTEPINNTIKKRE
ncbi:unnamed protein product, partial [Brachionus calyciflorus]